MATQTQQPPNRLLSEAEMDIQFGPDGPAIAAILAAALGVFYMGLATFIAAAALGSKDWFVFQKRVGPLSGKTTMACIAWLVSWGVLHLVCRKRDLPLMPIVALAGVLFVAGNLLMFPPIFQRFEP